MMNKNIPEHAALPMGFPTNWGKMLGPEFIKPYFQKLQTYIAAERESQTIFPAKEQVYEAYRLTSPERVRVVILGQDPYPTPGHAHGLAFSVLPGIAVPASLRNIYRELQADLGILPAKHGFLKSWAVQGVMLLNTVLTVRSGVPGSHARRGWEQFTDATLATLNRSDQPILFLLWGNAAEKKRSFIDIARHKVLSSPHPSPISANRGFFGSRPFSQINQFLVSTGQATIEWQLPSEVNSD